MIKYVLSDIGEVYLIGMKGVEDKIAPVIGVTPSESWDQLITEPMREMFRGRETEERYLQAVADQCGYPAEVSPETVRVIYDGELAKFNAALDSLGVSHNGALPIVTYLQAAMRANFEPVPGMDQLYQEVTCPLGLLSDHSKEWVEDSKSRFPIDERFNDQFWSYELGIRKRDVQGFATILPTIENAVGVSRNEMLFTDDNPILCASAAAAGVGYVHQFRDAATLREALVELGVLKE